MSRVVMALPNGIMKNTLIGGLLSLASYVLLQLVTAILLNQELLPEEFLYPAVCVSAAVASCIGCGFSVWRGRGASLLTVSAVVVVFLTVTVAVGFLTSDAVAVENGLTGVGLSMVAGALAAALVGSGLLNRRSSAGRRTRKRTRRRT